jgi:Zn-dependent protease with chaperone function
VRFDPSLPADGINVSKSHPLREALLLVAGVAGVVAAVALVIALVVDRIVPLVPPALEARLFSGGWLALDPDEAEEDPRTRALQALLDRLAARWPEAPYSFRAGLLEEETANALAFPGGRVLVTTGLHLRGLGRGVALSRVLAGFGLASGGEQVAGLAAGLAERSFGRDQERAADAFGLELVAAEYGHVAGAWEFFEKLPEPGRLGRALDTDLATHPVSRERVEDLRERARAAGHPATGLLAPLAPELRGEAREHAGRGLE